MLGSFDEIKEYIQPADEYLKSMIKQYNVIILGEKHGVKENLDFLIASLEMIADLGVDYIGMEFGAEEDQERLEKLVTADVFDWQLANDIMFNYNVKWAYQEYIDIYYGIWKINKTREKKLKVLNLSYKFNWAGFNGIRTPMSMEKVFYKGNIEYYRFNRIKKEVIEKNKRIVVLTGTIHAHSKYAYPRYNDSNKNLVYYNTEFMTNLLYQEYPNQVYSVCLHQAFSDPYTMAENQSPGNGKIEELMSENDNQAVGFDLKETPLGTLEDSSYYSSGYKNLILSDIFDGYLFLKPIKQLTGCTINQNYLKNQSFEEVINQFPDSDWSGVPTNESEYWEMIEDFVSFNK